MGGMSNQTESGSSLRSDSLRYFYSVYPSINLISVGQHSKIDLNYNFVAERFDMEPMVTTTSHTFSGSFNTQAGKRARFRLAHTLNTAPDFSTINVLKGIAPAAEGFQYIFEPQLTKRSNISNNSSIGLDVDLTDQSFLTFAASGSIRLYEADAIGSSLSDQTRISGSFGFSHKHSKRLTSNLKYTVWQNDYDQYETSRSHSATFGLTRELSPGLSLTLSAGPSLTEKTATEKALASYVVDANIAKQFEHNRFSTGYSHRASDSTGLGGSSDSHQIMMSFSQALGRSASINFQASAYRQELYDGVNGSIAFSQQLGRYMVASAGSSYISYKGYASKRFYASFGLRKTPRISQINTK